MSKITAMLLGAVLAAGTVLPASAQTTANESDAAVETQVGAETVVATVNGIDITVGHLVAAVRDLTAEEQQYPNDALFSGLIERLIQQAAVIGPDGATTPETALRLENARRELLAGARVEAMAGTIEVTDEDVQAAYDRRFADFVPAQEYNASHILVASEEEAKAIVAELQGGADFADLAKEKSTGPSGPSGGNLGWFGPGRMVPGFEAAVKTLEVGGISDPVETQFGWHVIKLNDTRLPEAPALETLSSEMKTEVFR